MHFDFIIFMKKKYFSFFKSNNTNEFLFFSCFVHFFYLVFSSSPNMPITNKRNLLLTKNGNKKKYVHDGDDMMEIVGKI